MSEILGVLFVIVGVINIGYCFEEAEHPITIMYALNGIFFVFMGFLKMLGCW